MKWFIRSTKHLIRHPRQTSILFIVMFTIGMVFAISLSLKMGIQDMEKRAKEALGQAFTVHFNAQDHNRYYEGLSDEERETYRLLYPDLEDYEAIGNLSYVKAYDLRQGTSLKPLDTALYTSKLFESDRGYSQPEELQLKGTSIARILEIEEGVLKLSEGRVFTEQELDEGAPRILIHRAFSELNDLRVGDTIRLEAQKIVNRGEGEKTEYLAEVIGIVEEVEPLNDNLAKKEQDVDMAMEITSLYNQLITTSGFVQEVSHFQYEQILGTSYTDSVNPLYLLRDQGEQKNFIKDASVHLPDFFVMRGTSDTYHQVAYPLEKLTRLSDYLIIFGSIAGVVVLSLVILMVLRGRIHEFGILIALGERRLKIIMQVFSEVFLLAIMALVLSFVVGSFLGGILTEYSVERRLTSEVEELSVDNPDYYTFGFFREKLDVDRLLSYYDSSPSVRDFLLFSMLSLISLVLATVAPLLFLFRLHPRDILTYR